MKWRWSHGAVILGVAAVMSPIPIAATAAPAVNSQWGGAASADGVRVGVVINGFLFVDNIVDAGGPSAQASAGSFTGSHALAAFPYPGEVVMTAHGQTSGAAPNYPLVAQSNNGGPSHNEVRRGPYDLEADSSDDASTAIAQTASGAGITATDTHAHAQVTHDPKTGVVTSSAESTTEEFSVAGVLSIGGVHSFARAATGARPSSDTEFSDVNVGGQEVGVTDKGLVLQGTDVPLPPDSTANALLKSAGVTVHYLAATTSPSSVVAPALAISAEQDVPSVGPTTVTYVLGQASASAQGLAASTPLQLPSAGAGAAPGAAPAAAPGSSSPATGSALGLTGSRSDGGPSPQTAPAPTGPDGVPSYQLAAHAGPSSQSLYLVIAGGALVAVAAAVLFRILAVKLAWT